MLTNSPKMFRYPHAKNTSLYTYTAHKNLFKIDMKLNVRTITIKLLEELHVRKS